MCETIIIIIRPERRLKQTEITKVAKKSWLCSFQKLSHYYCRLLTDRVKRVVPGAHILSGSNVVVDGGGVGGDNGVVLWFHNLLNPTQNQSNPIQEEVKEWKLNWETKNLAIGAWRTNEFKSSGFICANENYGEHKKNELRRKTNLLGLFSRISAKCNSQQFRWKHSFPICLYQWM